MGDYCENCGTRKRSGICSNCYEELYILECQYEYVDHPVSEEFRIKAAEQRREISSND